MAEGDAIEESAPKLRDQSLLGELRRENEELRREVKRLLKYETVVDAQISGGKRLSVIAFQAALGMPLTEALRKWLDAIAMRQVTTKEHSDLIAAVFSRIVRVGLLSALIALTPSLLLVWQNLLMRDQNQYLRDQIKEMQLQTTRLSEQVDDSRRGTNVVAVADVLADLANDDGRPLSKEMALRIYTISEGLVPYALPPSLFRRADQAIVPELMAAKTRIKVSPQRGALLLAMHARGEPPPDLPLHYNFEFSFLLNATLTGLQLPGGRLSASYGDFMFLDKSNLSGADLSGSSLRYARFNDAQLAGADFSNADLFLADLSLSKAEGANFEGARLEGANLIGAIIEIDALCKSGTLFRVQASPDLKKLICLRCPHLTERGKGVRDPTALLPDQGEPDAVRCPVADAGPSTPE